MKDIYITALMLVKFKQALQEAEKGGAAMEKYLRDLRRLAAWLQMIFAAGICVSEVPFITIETVSQGRRWSGERESSGECFWWSIGESCCDASASKN